MNILLLGSGGREHALAWSLSKSPNLSKLFVSPGNAGMKECAELVDVDASNHDAVISFCRDEAIDLVVIGPEAPLVAGLADDLSAANIKVFGPTKLAAQLEGSKGFTKDVCAKYDIPTAAYGRFKDADSAKAYITQQGAPIVVKADGLAAGKGVIMAMTMDEALEAVDHCFGGAFGAAGAEVVVEEFMEGEEASFFALSDGDNILALASAQDHKRVGDGDTGLNTGGMGAYSPAPVMTDEMSQTVMDQIIEPTIRAMREMGHPYQGVLFAGLMITSEGPKLIEHNCRFGDPECQVLMMRLQSDLLELLDAAASGTLDKVQPSWSDETALTVVLASKGYPGSYDKGTAIRNLDAANSDHAKTFHAGTAEKGGEIVAIGGRVLNVTARGNSVKQAQARAYDAVDQIDWENGFCRRDIGWRAVEREES
ncbi:MAG: phosphoribosylamine--glycine ligase [Hyphomicrobiales bacterium]